MAIAGLAGGLEAIGHRVTTLRPERPAPTLDLTRLGFNLALAGRIRGHAPDLAVGFDIDGFALTSPPRPYVVALKGVAADEGRFETGAQRARFRLLARLECLNARRADVVIATSAYSRDAAIRAYGLEEHRVRIVPEGIDVERWADAVRGRRGEPDGGGGRILSVARQYRRKSTADLLRAAAILVPRRPRLELHVVGGGPELPALRRLAVKLGVERHVRFLGPVESDDALVAEYIAADLFCLPSRQEGFGIVFLEAMATGLPIVAARAGAVPEVAPAGEVALLVPPEAPTSLAQAIERVLGDAELRRGLGSRGLRRWRQYSWKEVARAFVAATRVAPEEAAARY